MLYFFQIKYIGDKIYEGRQSPLDMMIYKISLCFLLTYCLHSVQSDENTDYKVTDVLDGSREGQCPMPISCRVTRNAKP